MPALAAVVLVAAACSGSESDDEEPDEFDDGAVAAEAAGNVADTGGCDMPVDFDIAEDWTVESVPEDTADTFEQGGLRPVCELSARDAGWIGFIRVWTGPGADAEQALEDYVRDVSGELQESDSRTVEIGGTGGFEISYVRMDSFDEENLGRAFAVPYDGGVVAVGVSGFDAEEYAGILPGYILARDTVNLVG